MNSPACVVGALPCCLSRRARSRVSFSGMTISFVRPVQHRRVDVRQTTPKLLLRQMPDVLHQPRHQKLDRGFYQRPAIELAPALLGKILARHLSGKELRARIVETEAYIGEHDLACHASKGRT